MKKIITALMLVLVLMLGGCTAKEYAPVIMTDFSLNAVYKTGDFSYNCIVERKNGALSVKPTSTRASGMLITYDGQSVTFDRNSMVYSFERNSIDSTNPAIVLYEVFYCVENMDKDNIRVLDDGYYYSGKTSVGNFVFIQGRDNKYKSVSIPNADISITFI